VWTPAEYTVKIQQQQQKHECSIAFVDEADAGDEDDETEDTDTDSDGSTSVSRRGTKALYGWIGVLSKGKVLATERSPLHAIVFSTRNMD
jgi:hypothetical protein